MEHGQIDGPLDIKLVAVAVEGTLENLAQAQSFPYTAKDQIRADPLHSDRLSLAGGMRVNDREFLRKAQTRTEQRVQLAGGLEDVQSSDGAQDPLMHVAFFPKAFDD